jgi:ATP-binding cassette subfamily B protein
MLVMFGVRLASRYFLIGVGRKLEWHCRNLLYAHLMALPRSYFDVHRTGELMSRLTNDLSALRMCMGGGVMLLVNVGLAYLTVLPMMALLSWPLTLLAFLLYPLTIWGMRHLSLKIRVLCKITWHI